MCLEKQSFLEVSDGNGIVSTQRECGVPSKPFLAELSVQYSLRALLSISPSSSRRRWRKFECNTANAAPPHFQETTGEWLNEFEHVTEEEVVNLIAFAPNKQSSLDPLPVKYLKKVSGDVYLLTSSTVHFRMDMCQASLRMPSSLNKAGLDVDDPNNFRPISNLSLTSKILKRLIWSCLDVHLNRIGILPSVQLEYRQNHSTKTASSRK